MDREAWKFSPYCSDWFSQWWVFWLWLSSQATACSGMGVVWEKLGVCRHRKDVMLSHVTLKFATPTARLQNFDSRVINCLVPHYYWRRRSRTMKHCLGETRDAVFCRKGIRWLGCDWCRDPETISEVAYNRYAVLHPETELFQGEPGDILTIFNRSRDKWNVEVTWMDS